MASPTQWTWVWVNSRSWWWTGRPRGWGPWCCQESDTTERLNWTELMPVVQWLSHVSLRLHGLQHSRLSCPSLPPGVSLNSYPLSWWCYPTISSSVAPLPCPQSFPASGSFPMSQLFASGGQSIQASVFPTNIQGWFPLGLAGFISLLRDSQESSPAAQFESTRCSIMTDWQWMNEWRKACTARCYGRAPTLLGKTVSYIIHYMALPLDQPSVNELEEKPDC